MPLLVLLLSNNESTVQCSAPSPPLRLPLTNLPLSAPPHFIMSASSTPSTNGPPLIAVRSLPTLTLAAAKLVSEAAEHHASRLGIAINIAVCDHTTQLLHFVRMDNAKLTSMQIAIDKAYTSAGHRQPTSYYTDISKEEGKAFGLPWSNGGRFSILAGGVPLFDKDGVCIGGVGASGGSPAQDVECVQKGVDALNAVIKGQ